MSANADDLSGCRILVVMPSIPVQGMERSVLQVMKMMVERNADVMFVTNRAHGSRVQKAVCAIGASFCTARADVQLLHLPRSLAELRQALAGWARGAWDIWVRARGYAPTHVFIPDLAFVLYALPALWLLRRPSIFYLPVPPDVTLMGFRAVLTMWLWRGVVSPTISVLVANSDFTRGRMRLVGIPAGKTTRIYPCLPERDELSSSDAPAVNSARTNIAFLGRVSRAKGLRELVDAAYLVLARREDLEFWIAGEKDWMNPFADALVDEVRSRGLTSRVHFLGEIASVMELLQSCDLLVCPTIADEPFGLVVLEAKAAGLPSVVFPSGGLVESVHHLSDGFVCRERSAASLAEGIWYFVENPRARSLAGRAAADSLARFSRDGVAKQWVALIRALA